MKIRPKEIPIYLEGGAAPLWYLDRYGNRTSLLGWNLNKRYNFANQNLNTNDHRNAGSLDMAYNKNMAYTKTPAAISSDIQSFYDTDGNGLSAENFVKLYNDNAAKIRSHWALDLTYNAKTAGEHNRLFKKMFLSRSNQSMSPGSSYNIGYLDDLDNIEGSSTWLRRMDLYENEFDINNPDTNRIHEIILKDGSKAKVYKKANGDIALLTDSLNGAPSETNSALNPLTTRGTDSNLLLGTGTDGQLNGSIQVLQRQDPESKWKIFGDKLKSAAPDILDALRLAGNLHNNERVYNAVLKGIRPNLLQTYNTYRQVVGDEATKQAYYRRGIAGQTKAGQAFTSDADRLMAYMMEAKRAADELKAQGDLADNTEIRRTSDESNQHAWGNVQRATEVANRNLIEMNNANAAKWNLKALKYSADWTNWDNYLMGIQNRWQQKKEEDKAFLRQLASLEILNDYINDDLLNQLQFNRQDLLELYQKEGIPTATKLSLYKQILELNKQINTRKLELEKGALKRAYDVLVAKSGSKIEYKYKRDGDKYLYKTSKDVVEHFRAMSRMSDESRLKSRTKPIKLSDHPKGSTKKYLLGGVAPFTIYRPLGVGGESTVTSQITNSGTSGTSSSKSSGKDEAAKNKLDLVKELFKSLQGLPVDVNTAYSDIYKLFEKSKLFGEEMSTDDIAGIYLNSIRSVNLLKHSLEVFEKAKAFATSLNSLQEYAVTAGGYYIALDKEGNLTEVKDFKEFTDNGLSPVTNQLLINMRAYSANMIGLKGDTILENVIGNGMGIDKIGEFIKSMANKIGTSETKLEGISQVEAGKVKAGLEILAGAPDGYYKITKENKTQLAQVNAALAYIENMLSPALKAILNTHGGTRPLIQSFLTSQLSATENISISPLTGKASDKDGKESLEKIKSSPLMQLILGEGGVPRTWNLITKDSNVKMSVDGIEYSQLPSITEDMSLNEMLSKSGIGGILDSKLGITFGDLNISPDLFKDIMYSNSGGMVVTLPCKIVNGHKEVNLGIKKTYEEAIQEVESKGISKNSKEYYKVLGEVLKQKGLNSLLDSNGYPDRNKFGLFLVVEAYTTDKIKNLDFSSQYIEKVKNPDALLEERMIKALSTDSKKSNYNLDIDYWLYGDNVYRGTVFIPLNNNLNAAINASGNLISIENARELENKFQNFNKASNMKSSNSDVL